MTATVDPLARSVQEYYGTVLTSTGQVAWYEGTIAEAPHRFELDDHHVLETGRPMLVCGNTADMLSRTRYGRHFRIQGDKTIHHGLFDCGPIPATSSGSDAAACC